MSHMIAMITILDRLEANWAGAFLRCESDRQRLAKDEKNGNCPKMGEFDDHADRHRNNMGSLQCTM